MPSSTSRNFKNDVHIAGRPVLTSDQTVADTGLNDIIRETEQGPPQVLTRSSTARTCSSATRTGLRLRTQD